jgi:hypothetical protein
MPRRLSERVERLLRKRAQARRYSRRYRRRQRAGTKLLRIEIANAEQTIAAWIALGLISEDQRNDDKAVEAAVARLCQIGFRVIAARAKATASPAPKL